MDDLNENCSQKFIRSDKGSSLLSSFCNYVVLDLETTGFDPTWDHIIEIAAIRVENCIVVDHFETLVNPNTKIGSFVTELTGITNEMLFAAPNINDVLPDFRNFVGSNIVVGHNVNFDINFLYDNCQCALNVPFANDFVDTMRLSRKLFKSESHHRLIDLVSRFHISDSVEHRALSDSIKTHYCYEYMKSYIIDHVIDITSLSPKKPSSIRAKEITTQTVEFNDETSVFNRSFVFTGMLEKMLRKDAMQLVVDNGGVCLDAVTKKTNFLVLGNTDYCSTIKDGKSTKQKKAELLQLSGIDIEIISENVFYSMLEECEALTTNHFLSV